MIVYFIAKQKVSSEASFLYIQIFDKYICLDYNKIVNTLARNNKKK